MVREAGGVIAGGKDAASWCGFIKMGLRFQSPKQRGCAYDVRAGSSMNMRGSSTGSSWALGERSRGRLARSGEAEKGKLEGEQRGSQAGPEEELSRGQRAKRRRVRGGELAQTEAHSATKQSVSNCGLQNGCSKTRRSKNSRRNAEDVIPPIDHSRVIIDPLYHD